MCDVVGEGSEPLDLEPPNVETIIAALDAAVFASTGKHISTTEILVLRGAWQGQTYAQIAAQHRYTADYLKNDIGPQLWKKLTQTLGEGITKSNCRVILRQQVYQRVTNTEHQGNGQLAPSPMTSYTLESNQVAQSQRQRQNLPPQDCLGWLGRKAEIQKLWQWLSFEHPTPRIAIEGIGGMGKTTLLLEMAYRCLHRNYPDNLGLFPGDAPPEFDAIVFTSAKKQFFTPYGIVPRFQREGTLRDILRAILRTLQCPDRPSASFEEASEQVLQALEHQRTLLLIDNLDTLDEQQAVISFLYNLPATVKVVITSREATSFTALRLGPLPQTEALQLVQQQAQAKHTQIILATAQKLYQTTGGVPAAIIYAVSQLALGYELPEVTLQLQKPTEDFARFYFENAVQSLHDRSAYRLLLALGLFASPPQRAALCAVAGISQSASEGLAHLQRLSLVQTHHDRYGLLPLTHSYVLALMTQDPTFVADARHRWVDWYLAFVHRQGGKDWKEWQDYSALEQEWENIAEVMGWCIAHDRYAETYQLWRDVKCYTYSQGYRQSRLNCWDTPLDWLNWLMQAAQARQDWAALAEIMADRAWKLTLLGQFQHLTSASILFTQAWELRNHQSPAWQIELATHIAAWHLEQDQYALAEQWLDQAQRLLDGVSLTPVVQTRYALNIAYHRGEISYKTDQYEASRTCFEQIVEQAQAIGWQRATFLAQDFLADIAIQQNNLEAAQQWLLDSLQVAEHHHDRCSKAYAQRSLARLERQRGNLTAAQQWAIAAKDNFESLGMVPEATETQQMVY